MAKIQQFSKANLKQLRVDIQSKFDEIEKEFGVSLSIGNISFDQNSFKTSLEATLTTGFASVAEANKAKDEETFRMYSVSYGLAPSDFGKLIRFQGEDFKICGIKPNHNKYPILCEQ